ncbi:MAG TPA: hypothetical protein VM261_01760 [Kofleriaceae bacterium]|nr:hypothetical protein [Kofleriaceae bacterium]
MSRARLHHDGAICIGGVGGAIVVTHADGRPYGRSRVPPPIPPPIGDAAAWLDGTVDERDSQRLRGDAAIIEALPSWLKSRRAEAAHKLLALPHD